LETADSFPTKSYNKSNYNRLQEFIVFFDIVVFKLQTDKDAQVSIPLLLYTSFVGHWVWAHKWACFEITHHTTTIQPNAPRISNYTLDMVRTIKTILFQCEPESLIALLSLYAGIHFFSLTMVPHPPPAKDTMYYTLHPKQEIHTGYLSAEVKGVYLASSLVGSWGMADCGLHKTDRAELQLS
jgi:hypothetical protein